MFKPTNENAKKLLAEMEAGWIDSFMLSCDKLPPHLKDGRTNVTPVSRVLGILDQEKQISNVKKRKAELLVAYANGETPTLTVEEESRITRNEEAFYGLLVRWGVCEEITEDDLLDL